jgi:hypothetical protein
MAGTLAELADCQGRCGELEALLERARLVLDLDGGSGPRSSYRTLHDAMALVLADRPAGLAAAEIAAEINRRGLYRRRDEGTVDAVEVHARASRYQGLFRRRDGKIALQPRGARTPVRARSRAAQ